MCCSEIIKHKALVQPASKTAHHKPVSEKCYHDIFYRCKIQFLAIKRILFIEQILDISYMYLYTCILDNVLNINNTLTIKAATIGQALRLLVEKIKKRKSRIFWTDI